MEFLIKLFLIFLSIMTQVSTLSRPYYPNQNEINGEDEVTRISSKKNISSLMAHYDEKFSKCGLYEIDIRELSISKVQKYFQKGELSSTGLTLCYLKRILVMNPYLKAVIEINPEVIRIALRADLERMLGMARSSLHGIPILIKDNMATFDKMQTTAGAIAMEYVTPKRDADVVKRLREAGAVILGKSNPSEWADFRGTNIPGGWSGRGGQTRSPYVLSTDPSGSSAGSAVAVASNLAMVALGTETDGSIISPSSLGSLVGLKPTLRSVSMRGIIPLSFSQDVIGPIARTVSDAQILFNVISIKRSPNRLIAPMSYQYSAKLDGYRIGVVRYPFWNASDPRLISIIPRLEATLEVIKTTGMLTVIDPVNLNTSTDFVDGERSPKSELTVLFHEFKHGLNKYLEEADHQEFRLGRKIRSLSDIIRFNELNPYKGYNQEYLIAADATDGIHNETYKEIRDENKANTKDYINLVLDTNNLDAMVGPCDSKGTLLLRNVGSISGYPSITVPVGMTNGGIPFGICFLGRANSDRLLLNIALLFEKTLAKRRMPRFFS